MLHHVGAKIWLFLLEGTPAVVLGFVTYFFLDDGPANSVWLKDREKQILLRRLSEDQAGREAPTITDRCIRRCFLRGSGCSL